MRKMCIRDRCHMQAVLPDKSGALKYGPRYPGQRGTGIFRSEAFYRNFRTGVDSRKVAHGGLAQSCAL